MATDALDTRRPHHPCAAWLALRGLLALALGAMAILFPETALFAFTTVFAAFALADGLASLAAGVVGMTHHQEHWGALSLRGLLGLAAGLLFVLLPIYATLGYALLSILIVAAWAIAGGLLEIAAALRLRSAVSGEWLLAASGGLSILLGLAILVMLFLFPAASLLSLAWIIGAYALFAGAALIGQAARLWRRAG